MTTARYYWLEHDAALRRQEKALASAWKSQALDAEAAPGFSPLPTTFPAHAALTAPGARFVTLADLEGVTLAELLAAGLSSRDAAAVLAALP